MIKEILSYAFDFNFQILTIVPSVIYILICDYTIFRELSNLKRIKWGLISLCSSFFVMSVFQRGTYCLLEALLSRFLLQPVILYLLKYFVYLFYTSLFSFVLICTIDRFNRVEKPTRLKKSYFASYVFAQYLLIVFVSFTIGTTLFSTAVTCIVLYGIWFYLYKDIVIPISYIYAKGENSTIKICLVFEINVTLLLWFLPRSILLSQEGDYPYFFLTLSIFALLIYLFSLAGHKVIFNELIYRDNAYRAKSIDPLTNLFSRIYFIERAEEQRKEVRNDNPAIIYFNIENFKYYNQQFGSKTGDKILYDFSIILRKVFFESNNILSRFSDDHFAVYLENERDITEKMILLQRYLEDEETLIKIRVQAGIYVLKPNDELTKAIDYAICTVGKIVSGDFLSFRVFDESIIEDMILDEYIINELDNALLHNAIKVYYQPIVNINDNKIFSAEALVHWQSEKYGYISPGRFIPVLEEKNLTYKVDLHVIEDICKHHQSIIKSNYKPIPISFNISRHDFLSCDMVKKMDQIVKKYDIPANLVKVEITESVSIGGDDYLEHQIKRFQELNYSVWMDDFGSGYSSLYELGKLKMNGVKIDMSFLRNITPEKIIIMKGVVEVTKNLGMDVLTEGVETEEHIAILKEIGCSKAQGYYYSKPIPFEDSFDKINLEDMTWICS